LELQSKIDEKNLELESCNNKISELIDELNQNEQDFYDSKAKIRHLQNIVSQYQTAYPSFKPESTSKTTISPLLMMPINDDDYDIVPDLMQQPQQNQTKPSSKRRKTFIQQTNLLENLFTLHQRMESKMKETESTLNKIQNLQLMRKNSLQPIDNESGIDSDIDIDIDDVDVDIEGNSNNSLLLKVTDTASTTLQYESADEKLSEYDLDVSTGRDSEVNQSNPSNRPNLSNQIKRILSPTSTIQSTVDDVGKIKNSKQLRKHLKSLSKNEKQLKHNLSEKLKQEARNKSVWCQCFWAQKSPKDKFENNNTAQLIDEYLKMQVRRELVKDKYQRKKEKNRAKILKKRMKNKSATHHFKD